MNILGLINYFRRSKLNIEIKDDKTLGKIYEDALQPAAKQIGGALEDTLKTARLILAPLAFGGVGFDRFQKWCNRIRNNVKEDNMQSPNINILIPTINGLSLNPDETLLGEMFFNILQSSIDKTKQKFLSPAFPKILEQLTKDEAIMLVLLKKQKYKHHKKFDFDENTKHFFNEEVELNEIPLDKFEFQENIWLYNDHLHYLNLSGCWEYKPPEPIYSGNEIEKGSGAISCHMREQIGVKQFYEFSLTPFGETFADVSITKECEEFLK